MDYTKDYLELLKGHLLSVNLELITWEEIYESNQKSLKDGNALKTAIALASHKMMKESIDVKRKYYYEIESKIDATQQLLNILNND